MKPTDLDTIYNWLSSAKAMVVTAGAGMGVDSGLASYRNENGQWGQVETQTGKSVFEVVNPIAFIENPAFAWELFAERLIEYTHATPHEGYRILLKWANLFKLDYFVLTSNIDQQFLKAGFASANIREMHGSVFYLQCTKPCSSAVWEHNLNLDTVLAEIEQGKYPVCPNCGEISRPNAYLFRDSTYLPQRTEDQKQNFQEFLRLHKNGEIIVFEIGSGPHVQSIRQKTRMLGSAYQAKIVRINPKDYQIKEPHIGIQMGALEALSEIDRVVEQYNFK